MLYIPSLIMTISDRLGQVVIKLQSNYGRRTASQKGLSNKSFIHLSLNRCPSVSIRRRALSNSPSGSSSVSPLANSRSIPLLTKHSLHRVSKLSPSIRMIRLCNTMHTRAHMMMIMWRLVSISCILISFSDWNVPFSNPIVCSIRMRIWKQ